MAGMKRRYKKLYHETMTNRAMAFYERRLKPWPPMTASALLAMYEEFKHQFVRGIEVNTSFDKDSREA